MNKAAAVPLSFHFDSGRCWRCSRRFPAQTFVVTDAAAVKIYTEGIPVVQSISTVDSKKPVKYENNFQLHPPDAESDQRDLLST